MIIYFSGTGNTKYAAEHIGSQIQDEVVDLTPKLRTKDYSPLRSDRPWVIAAPVYAWQLPLVVRDWILETEFSGSREFYFVITCGGSIGNTEGYLKKLCKQKNFVFKGCAEIVMPENYIAMFDAPGPGESKKIIEAAKPVIQKTADRIARREDLPPCRITAAGKLQSGLINDCFYRLFVHDRKFYAKDSCTGCGLCGQLCPLSNIAIRDDRPVWGGNCTHCMACICRCPAEAIEYGRASRGKNRYYCPEMD